MADSKTPLSGLSLSSFAQPQRPDTDKRSTRQSGEDGASQNPAAHPPTVSRLSSQDQSEPQTQKPVTVNVKILKQQQDWLRDAAQAIRDNNHEAVPACDRVYPQHLIQVAIDMLRTADVDWAKIHNAKELRRWLGL